MATSATKPSPADTSKTKSAKPRKLIMVLVALIGLLGLGAVAAYLLMDHFRPSAAAAKPVVVPDPIYVALAPMTVNLQPSDKHRFLHVAVTLKVPDAKAQAQVTQYLPEVTSRLLLLLANRQSETLVTAENKAKLAADALSTLTQPFGPNLPALKISAVMFPVFMFQ